MSHERRIEPRLVVPMRVRYKVHHSKGRRTEIIETMSQNIGLGGLMLLAHQRLEEGTPVDLEIYMQPSDKVPVQAEGLVSWQSQRSLSGGQGRFDTGIRFRFMSLSDKSRFLDFTFRNQDRLIGLKRKKF
ncbi:MAG: PilZ domain-containing protein [Candidatus Omnitrophica bacterium]|nr:PilZ domain-containing protein [Candidatus Omnitrophota bacterium]